MQNSKSAYVKTSAGQIKFKIYPVKLNFYFTGIMFIAILSFSLFGASKTKADDLADFEDGLFGPPPGYFLEYENDRTFGPDYQTIEIDSTQGADGTNQCLKDTVTEGNIFIFYHASPTSKIIIPQTSNADRLSFFLKLPDGYPLMPDNNFSVGTYTRDPINGDPYSDGTHYYHLFNIPGSQYWTKLICNEHPQVLSGQSTDPGNNPESWDYLTGFTRFYIDVSPQSPISLPWSGYIDEVQFYALSEPENDESINSIACTYMGSGEFNIGWHGCSQYEDGNCDNHEFEIRYSNSPITNSNYASATIVSGSPFSQYSGSYNFWQANFTIPVTEGETYYFAIKDLDSSSSYVSKIDYTVYPEISDTTPPSAPSGLSVS